MTTPMVDRTRRLGEQTAFYGKALWATPDALRRYPEMVLRQIAGIYYKDDLIAEPMRLIDGAIELPAENGMGIPVDEAKIRRYCVD